MPTAKTELLTTEQAAEWLGVTEGTLKVWRCQKRYSIPFIKVGGRVRYNPQDLENWLASRKVGQPELVAQP